MATIRFKNNYHSKSVEDIFKEFTTNKNGLSEKEAKKRLEKEGYNELPEKKTKHAIFLFLKQFKSFLIYVLIIAAVISFFADHLIDFYVIIAVILLNAVMGFIQEYKAEQSINALKDMIVHYAKVYRNGELIQISIKELVPGDIIFLEEGDMIPADARLFYIKNFRTVEASLTGESLPIDKDIKSLNESIALGDRKNMVWMSTFVAGGQAKAIVTATGIKTEIGKIAKSLEEIKKEKGHFEQKTDFLGKQMAAFAFGMAALTFIIGFFFKDYEFYEIFLFTVASLVSGIPEGLPAILVIVLAIGANRMAKKNAIIRNLPATETLGVTTAIATDKTGTLTQNVMSVKKIILPDQNEISVSGEGWEPKGYFYQKNKTLLPLKNKCLSKLLHIASICNSAKLIEKEGLYKIMGDPTEAALVTLSEKAGLKKEELIKTEKKLDDLPFNPELKYRASLSALIEENNKKQIYVVGAPEVVLETSSHLFNNKKITKEKRKEILKEIQSLAKQGMRVLGFAYKKVPNNIKELNEDLVKDLVFVGFVGMLDPPRPRVKEAIAKAKKAGIRVIMKTGDHKDTALSISKEIGLIDENTNTKYPLVLTEQDLLKLSEKEFEDVVKHVSVFARLTPNMKLKLVETLQKQGHIVAMTGDGINDALALKKADIGIAMGIMGTDVARESSSMVLADDNFASIIDAIEEGKTIFTNTRQASAFLVTTNFAEDTMILGTLIFGFPLPLLPTHILFLNLVTDGVSDIALAIEPSHENVLEQPPRKARENILCKEIIPFMVVMMSIMAVLSLAVFLTFLPYGLEKARTGAFVVMAFTQLFNVINMRSLKKSIFKIGFFSNKYMLPALIFSVSILFVILYLPFFQTIFQFVSLSAFELLSIIALSSLVFWVGEAYKYLKKI